LNRSSPTLRLAISLVKILALAGVGLIAGYGLLILAFGLLLTAGPAPYIYIVEPSPDRAMSLVTRVDGGGGATNPAREDVYLVGATFQSQADLGSYFHGGSEAGDGWRTNRQVNVCMLRYPFETQSDAADSIVKVTPSAGPVATVRVTKQCPPKLLKAWHWRWG
jgi:hypothetical protein